MLKSQSDEFINLDFVRFIAAICIVMTHSMEFMYPRNMREISHEQGAGLALFVDVFFVISGFIIAQVYSGRLNNVNDYGKFIQRRIGRLIPLHILTLAVSYVLFRIIIGAGVKMEHPPSLSMKCLVNTALLLHAAIDCGGAALNGVSWSISAEMFMYALFPIFAYLANRGRWYAAALPVVGWLLAWILSGSVVGWAEQQSVVRALPAFSTGVAMHVWRDRVASLPIAPWSTILGLSFLVAGSLLRLPTIILLPTSYIVPIIAISSDASRKHCWIVKKLSPFGQLTYSMYMIHGIIIFVILNGIADKMLHLSTVPMAMVTVLCYMLIFCLSWASFRLFETPARRIIDNIPIICKVRV